jgi:glutamate-ammonia-ligase adenylyltransferase
MDLPPVLQFSRYATRALAAHPAEAAWLERTMSAPFPWAEEDARLAEVARGDDPQALATALRHLRRRVLVHTVARDLAGRADLMEVVTAVTRLA